MSDTAAQQPNRLHPAILGTMVRNIMLTIPSHPSDTEEHLALSRDAALVFVNALDPRDTLEAVLAGDVLSANHLFTEASRCGVRPDLPPVLRQRFQSRALSLAMMRWRAIDALLRRRDQPPVMGVIRMATPQPEQSERAKPQAGAAGPAAAAPAAAPGAAAPAAAPPPPTPNPAPPSRPATAAPPAPAFAAPPPPPSPAAAKSAPLPGLPNAAAKPAGPPDLAARDRIVDEVITATLSRSRAAAGFVDRTHAT